MYPKQIYVGGKRILTSEAQLWYDIKKRTNPESAMHKRLPTYHGCKMSENFKDFQYFAEWCNKQQGFGLKDKQKTFHLDKDLLIKGNKEYSEKNCVFLPPDVNIFLTKRQSLRGNFPIGVSWHKRDNVYTSQCNDGCGNLVHFGYFSDPWTAHLKYKEYKESLAKTLADRWMNVLDSRAYTALYNYEVTIDQ